MDAALVMTRSVVSVAPNTPVSEIARLMVEKRISAVPVLDGNTLIGIISEGDLLRRSELGTGRNRSRWLELALSSHTLAADYVKEHGRKAVDVMTPKVISVAPTTPLTEVAQIMESRHIKRVLVVADGQLVGIVSRANLVQALASSQREAPSGTPEDRDIHTALSREIRDQRWAFVPSEANVVVRNGEVHLWGFVGSEEARRAMVVIAENVPGVRGVHDHMEYPPVYPF